MIGGVGVDMVDVSRLDVALQRSAGFAEMVFTDAERDAAGDGAARARRLAAVFAAKEAFLKAVGRGLWQGVALREIEVVGSRLRLGPTAREALDEVRCRKADLSLSHGRATAIAVVLVH